MNNNNRKNEVKKHSQIYECQKSEIKQKMTKINSYYITIYSPVRIFSFTIMCFHCKFKTKKQKVIENTEKRVNYSVI